MHRLFLFTVRSNVHHASVVQRACAGHEKSVIGKSVNAVHADGCGLLGRTK